MGRFPVKAGTSTAASEEYYGNAPGTLEGTQMEPANRFAKVRADLLETVINFPEGKVEEAVCGPWDIKCVLSHIAGWDTYFTMAVRLLRMDKDVPFRGDKVRERNGAFVKEREG
jgi:hypothetical protein